MRIGIDLGGTKIEGVALDDAGGERWRDRVAAPRGDYAATLQAIAALVARIESDLGIRDATVGIGTPGAVSPATGRMKNCNSTWLNDRPLREDLRALLGRELRLANDADCLALSEASDGAGAGARCVFGVILGTGTGGGICVDGRLLSGPNAIAGEWGHNLFAGPRNGLSAGRNCYCGRQDCVETWLSGPGLERTYRELGGREADAARVARRAEVGDAGAKGALDLYVEQLAFALSQVINLLDPDVIVLGGGVSNIDRLYHDVPRCWGRYVFSDTVSTRLVPARHGDSSGVRGAARLFTLLP